MYGPHNNIDFMKFPIEILLEIILSFLMVSIGSIIENCKLEEIHVDHQSIEK